MKAQLFFDGGARPTNPGHSGFGVLVQADNQEIEIGRYLGWKTNNEAEYTGLIVALKTAKALGAEEVVITGDSLLVINTVQGEWRCKKDHLRRLMHEAREILHSFAQWEFIHVRGHQGHVENERVDQLCTDAILKGMSDMKIANPFTRIAKKTVKPVGKVVDPFQ